MFRKRSFVSAVLGLAVLVSALPAVEKSITLEEAVAQALDKHPAVVQARLEVDAARGRRMQLTAVPNPELAFEAVGLPLWNSSGEKEFSLGFSQIIEYPRKRAVRRDIGALGEAGPGSSSTGPATSSAAGVERATSKPRSLKRAGRPRFAPRCTLEDYTGLAVERYKAGEVAYPRRRAWPAGDPSGPEPDHRWPAASQGKNAGPEPPPGGIRIHAAELLDAGRIRPSRQDLGGTESRRPGRLLYPPRRRGGKAGRPLPCPGQDA